MSACTEHIQYQLPSERSHVGFLIDAIQCANAGLQAAMASVKTDNGPNSKILKELYHTCYHMTQ